MKDYAKTKIGDSSFCISAGKLWNNLPAEIRETKNISVAKRMIKSYSDQMPI